MGLDFQKKSILIKEGVKDSNAGEAQAELFVERVWVDSHGGAKLLSFPIASPKDDGPDPTPAADWRELLHQVVQLGLEGRAADRRDGSRVPLVPLPESARPLVERLCGLGEPFGSPGAVAAALDELGGKPTRISRARRFGPLALQSTLFSCDTIPH